MSKNRTLLVEGPNDYHVLKALLQHHGFKVARLDDKYPNEGDFVFKVKGSVEELLKGLPEEIKSTEESQLGVILDADLNFDNPEQSIEDRWKAIAHRLRESGYISIPTLPDVDGTIVIGNQELPTIGIWVMPDNQFPGKIEDFIRLLVQPDSVSDLLWKRAEIVVEAIPKTERLFSENNIPKVNVHTYLAWQEEPGCPMGGAITRRYFAADAEIANKFIAWIRKLFSL